MRADAQVRKGATAADANDAVDAVEAAEAADAVEAAEAVEAAASDRLRIAEIYVSRQGEGRWTGAPSVFLRTSGCNLRCWFCDTPFASWRPEGDTLNVEQIVRRVLAYSEPDAVITGGEPLIFPGISDICRHLRQSGRRVTIETAGTIDRQFECDLLSISPKLSTSAPDARSYPAWHAAHNARRQRLELVRSWIERMDYQLKFVISQPSDTDEVLAYLGDLRTVNPQNVWLMPEGTTVEALESRAAWLAPWCQQHGFQYCPRSHIYWYGNRRGT